MAVKSIGAPALEIGSWFMGENAPKAKVSIKNRCNAHILFGGKSPPAEQNEKEQKTFPAAI